MHTIIMRLPTLLLVLALCLFVAPITPGQRGGKPAEAKTSKEKDDDKHDHEEEEDRWLHVTNIDLYPVTSAPMPSAEILVKNDKVVAIGRGLEVPEEAEVLDGLGYRCYPGLIALNGGQLVPSGGGPGDALDPDGLTTIMALAHGITTTLSNTTAVKLVAGTLEGAVLRQQLFQGLFYSSTRPQQKAKLRADLTKARDLHRGVLKGKDGKKPNIGQAAQYLPLFEGKKTAVFNVTDTHSILEACELIETFGFRAVLRGCTEGWVVPGAVGRSGAYAMLIPRQTADPDEKLNRPTGSNMDNASILYNHGVPVIAATPQSRVNMDGQPGKDALAVAFSAASMVGGGLPEKAALEAVTITAARAYGLEDRIGSIEVGKDADFVIVTGEMLHYATMVQYAVVNGRVAYNRDEQPLYRHIRPRDPKFERGAAWWPRPFGEMPEEWSYDPAKVAAERAAKEAAEKAEEGGASDDEKKADAEKKKAPAEESKK